ncbi:MAG: hypothetical protein GQ570_12155 [Helicobacteraceae bacterium]|nr:hypothetical protein [Helicobacteraceae bacterium]
MADTKDNSSWGWGDFEKGTNFLGGLSNIYSDVVSADAKAKATATEAEKLKVEKTQQTFEQISSRASTKFALSGLDPKVMGLISVGVVALIFVAVKK